MTRLKKTKSEEENQKPVFFNSSDVLELSVNKNLPVIEILEKESRGPDAFVKFTAPDISSLLNIFLIVNGLKKDMLYQVKSGQYSFKFNLWDKENLVELFYVKGNSRSYSSSFIL